MAKIYRFFQHPGVKTFLLVVTLFAAIVAALAVLIKLSTGWPFSRAFDASFAGIAFGLLLVNLGQMVISRPRAGPVLLDAGPSPQRSLYIFLASTYFVLNFVGFDFQHPLASLKSEINILILTAFFAALAFGRLQVCERGIWLYTALLPWGKIKSYVFHEGTLYFRTNGLWFWAQTTCFVAEAHVEAFETYLLEHHIPDNTAESVALA